MVIIIIFLIFVIICVILGIIQYFKVPKPPNGLSFRENQWWYGGGWKEVQAEEEEQEKILGYLKSGKKMDAIKAYKDFHECSLSKAKTAISEIEWELEYARSHESEDPFQTRRSCSGSPTSEVDRYIEKCIKSGKKIEAVKIYRENYSCGLAEAKTAVEEKERLIRGREKLQNGGKERLLQWREENNYACGEEAIEGTRRSISSIDGMDGHQFEYFCADLLRKVGFVNVHVTPGSGDQGVDILAEKDGVRYAIQCKNYATPLGNTPVQEVSAGKTFYNCHVGVVMTNSIFTHGAESLARATGVLLWNRAHLEQLMKQAGV